MGLGDDVGGLLLSPSSEGEYVEPEREGKVGGSTWLEGLS